MIRKIIQIDEERCNGCGACATACHEGAIGMINGKAKLLRDDYCDGFGDCLPACPVDAIHFVEREAAPYDEAAVQANMAKKSAQQPVFQCPGSRMQSFAPRTQDFPPQAESGPSEIRNWPVQIKLAPVKAPYFDGANLLIAADCSAFAYGEFHRQFLRNHVVLIGCPKLDMVDYTEKLTQIIRDNDIQSVSIVRMEVPCCGALERAAKAALQTSGKFIPWQVRVISVDGRLLP